jgi:hypothetical protein
LLVSWIVFPVVLTVICLGCGHLLSRAAGLELSLAIRLGVGLAVVVVVSGLTTAASPTAPATVPAVLGMTLIGLALAPRRRPGRETWVAVAVIALALAPEGRIHSFAGRTTRSATG